jgi:hypothetical protein
VKKPRSLVTVILGAALVAFGAFLTIAGGAQAALIPLLVGGSLVHLGWAGGRVATLVFGHACIVVGSFMIAWGIYLLPVSRPTLAHVFGRPLFWGMISVFGGICANYHGFCRCIGKSRPEAAGDAKR